MFDFVGDEIEEGFFAGLGSDGQDHDEIDLVEVGFDDVEGSAGVEGNASQNVFAALFDKGEAVGDVESVFDGKGNGSGSGFAVGGDAFFGFVDKEVDVFDEVGVEAGDEVRADGGFGPDDAVHDVDVEERDVAGEEGLDGGGLVLGGQGADGELGLAAFEAGDGFGAGHGKVLLVTSYWLFGEKVRGGVWMGQGEFYWAILVFEFLNIRFLQPDGGGGLGWRTDWWGGLKTGGPCGG